MIICPTCHKQLGCIENMQPGEIFTCDICQQVWIKIDGKIVNSEQYYKMTKPRIGGNND